MDDRGTRQRKAYRADWLAGLRNKPNNAPDHEDADLDRRWMDGLAEGNRLRLTWKRPRNEIQVDCKRTVGEPLLSQLWVGARRLLERCFGGDIGK